MNQNVFFANLNHLEAQVQMFHGTVFFRSKENIYIYLMVAQINDFFPLPFFFSLMLSFGKGFVLPWKLTSNMKSFGLFEDIVKHEGKIESHWPCHMME